MSPLDGIRQVQLELNNRCSYAHLHPKCPASLVKVTKFLPTDIVMDVLWLLQEHAYDGEVIFSIYNEPLEDPRLMAFLKWMLGKRQSGTFKGTPYIITNGRCLDQGMLTELTAKYGARLIANGYTQEEAEHLRSFDAPRYTVREDKLDDRMKMYDCDPADLQKPCHAPSRNLTIWHTGQVGVCCRDWKRTAIIGDLNTQTLEQVLNLPGRAMLIRRLEAGDRSGLDVCRKCTRRWAK